MMTSMEYYHGPMGPGSKLPATLSVISSSTALSPAGGDGPGGPGGLYMSPGYSRTPGTPTSAGSTPPQPGPLDQWPPAHGAPMQSHHGPGPHGPHSHSHGGHPHSHSHGHSHPHHLSQQHHPQHHSQHPQYELNGHSQTHPGHGQQAHHGHYSHYYSENGHGGHWGSNGPGTGSGLDSAGGSLYGGDSMYSMTPQSTGSPPGPVLPDSSPIVSSATAHYGLPGTPISGAAGGPQNGGSGRRASKKSASSSSSELALPESSSGYITPSSSSSSSSSSKPRNGRKGPFSPPLFPYSFLL